MSRKSSRRSLQAPEASAATAPPEVESALLRWLKERRITEKKTRSAIKRGRSSRVDHD